MLRWFLDEAQMTAPTMDNAIGTSTTYDHRYEAIAVLGARESSLHGELAGRRCGQPNS